MSHDTVPIITAQQEERNVCMQVGVLPRVHSRCVQCLCKACVQQCGVCTHLRHVPVLLLCLFFSFLPTEADRQYI